MSDDQTSPGHEFRTTQWSVVLAAGSEGSPQAAQALQRLCYAYWYPLYAHVRRCGHGAHDAQDLTQEFFTLLLRRRDLAEVRREKGRFRSFLLASLEHFLCNERKKANRLKRGGGKIIISIDPVSAEKRYACEPSHDLAPDKLFERRWALTLLGQVIDQLREEFRRANKLPLFEQLKVFLTGDGKGPAYADVAAQTGLTEAAVKMTVARLRRRYRDVVRLHIANTVGATDDIEDEIRHLFAALG